jgi:hypothetical protein
LRPKQRKCPTTPASTICGGVAFDPQGEFRGYGFGYSPEKARAGPWITAWWPVCDLRAVPRVVSEGWTFESYPPGESPVFER